MTATVAVLKDRADLRLSQALAEHATAQALLDLMEDFRALSEAGDDAATDAFAAVRWRLREALANRTICALAAIEAQRQRAELEADDGR